MEFLFIMALGLICYKRRRERCHENTWNSGKTKIVRETPTTFVLEKFIRDGKIRKLSNCNWKNLSDEKIDSILKIIEPHKEDN